MTAASRAPAARWPSPEQVLLLQAAQNTPCVSLLATTTPASRMGATDAATLQRLADEAAARVHADGLPGAAALVTALRDTVTGARSGPTSRGVGIFVNRVVRQVVHLPVPVVDRTVVDPTFATRDLVRSLHRTPRHVVLLLSEREARLFDGVGEHLTPPARSAFPLVAAEVTGGARPRAGDQFLREVDQALGTYLRLHPAPLVLVGAERTVGRFRRLSRNTGRLAGTVAGSRTRAPLASLVPRIGEVMDRYLLSREAEALELIDRRRSRSQVIDGIGAAWLAARHEEPEMLAVEEGFTYPARISADGDFLTPAGDVEHPDVIDDAVDELIETVIRRGGWVAFVRDGRLADHDRVALTVR